MSALIPATAVAAAAARIAGVVRRTPLRPSPELSRLVGREVLLKLECQQVTGSFKLRGAFNAIAMMPDDVRARGVVASSAGNHGLGVAYAAKHFGVPATIYVPATAPAVKRDGIARLGATVDASQPDYDAAMATAMQHAASNGKRYINPCLGDDLLAGQGTVAIEILEEKPDVATVVLPVGGGGLLGGMGAWLRECAPRVKIRGAQSEETSAMAKSLYAGRVVEVPHTPTLADGLAGQIDETALAIGQAALDGLALVTEQELARAVAWLADEEDLVVEGSGAVGVAALLTKKLVPGRGAVAVVVSGGNIDPERLAAVKRGEWPPQRQA